MDSRMWHHLSATPYLAGAVNPGFKLHCIAEASACRSAGRDGSGFAPACNISRAELCWRVNQLASAWLLLSSTARTARANVSGA